MANFIRDKRNSGDRQGKNLLPGQHGIYIRQMHLEAVLILIRLQRHGVELARLVQLGHSALVDG